MALDALPLVAGTAGPIWALHSFYLVTSALMVVWYLTFTGRVRRAETLARRTLSVR